MNRVVVVVLVIVALLMSVRRVSAQGITEAQGNIIIDLLDQIDDGVGAGVLKLGDLEDELQLGNSRLLTIRDHLGNINTSTASLNGVAFGMSLDMDELVSDVESVRQFLDYWNTYGLSVDLADGSDALTAISEVKDAIEAMHTSVSGPSLETLFQQVAYVRAAVYAVGGGSSPSTITSTEDLDDTIQRMLEDATAGVTAIERLGTIVTRLIDYIGPDVESILTEIQLMDLDGVGTNVDLIRTQLEEMSSLLEDIAFDTAQLLINAQQMVYLLGEIRDRLDIVISELSVVNDHLFNIADKVNSILLHIQDYFDDDPGGGGTTPTVTPEEFDLQGFGGPDTTGPESMGPLFVGQYVPVNEGEGPPVWTFTIEVGEPIPFGPMDVEIDWAFYEPYRSLFNSLVLIPLTCWSLLFLYQEVRKY